MSINQPIAARTLEEVAKADGTAKFTADTGLPDGLHAAFLLATHPHARIRSIDKSGALALPGVVTVLTGADIGLHLFGRSLRDYPVLATDRVMFAGQRVAAVAAEDAETARSAAALIDVDYEILEPLLDPERATDDDVAELHPDSSSYDGTDLRTGGKNVQGQEQGTVGDGLSAFDDCDSVYDHVFRWARSHAAPLEPHACNVIIGPEQVHVFSAHKEPFKLRRDLALVSGRPESDFAVEPIHIGGDFGAKGSPFIEAACYFLAVATGRPVSSVMTFYELLTSTSARSPGTMRLRTGLRDGRFHAHEARTLWDGGAFAAIKPRPLLVQPVLGIPLGPYAAPNRDETSVCVYTNSLPGGQVRSPGEFQATFAGECHVDMIARALGEDPVAFRLASMEVPEAKRVLEELAPIVERWRNERRQPLGLATGIGVSVFHRGTGGGTSRVACQATADGVLLSVGVPDQGAGSFAAFAARAAGVLAIPQEYVDVRPVGAAPGLMDSGAGASRVTAVAGRACELACQALLDEIGAPPDDTERADGYWIADRLGTLGHMAAQAEGEWTTARGDREYTAASHGAMAIEVDVDRDTGSVRVHRAAMVIDGGRILNPLGYRGQLEGGFVYGLSQTLFEELAVEDGQVVTASLGDYKLASASDVPPLEIVLLPPESDDARVRGVGELANLGPPPAISNAIADAIGVRICELPITAERVLAQLAASGSESDDR